MKIAFNALSAQAGAGISVFQNLLPALAKMDDKNEYFIIVSENQKEILDFIPEKFNVLLLKKVPSNPYFRVLYEQLIIPIILHKNKIDLLYSVGNTTALFALCKVLLFIENLNPFTKVVSNWSFKERIRNKLLFYLTKLSALKADKIRFCSERSREIICQLLNVPIEKTFVIYHGINLKEFIKEEASAPFSFNYILGVSVVAPHKNFEVLISAFNILKKEFNYNGKLVIVGDTCYTDYYKKLLKLIKENDLEGEIIFTGKVKNSEIYRFYKYADLFLFPSLAETFGIPLIEALIAGVPVVASDGYKCKNLFIPFNELAGEDVVYFDPYSEVDLVEKIKLILYNDEIKKKFKEKADFYRNKFDIQNIAKLLVGKFNESGVKQ
jgi:glycosyltransferase involved in cell wall biosynthesis